MGKRKSESLSAAISKEEFDKTLIMYSANDIKLSGLKAELEEEMQSIVEEYSSDIDLLQANQKLLFATIKAYCLENRAVLIATDKKSFENLYAKIGFRKDPPSIKFNTGVKEDMVVDKLKELNLLQYIRTVDEINKELLLADREKEIANNFSELGLKIKHEEKFYVELKKVELKTA